MSDRDDVFENPEYEYKFKYINCIKFESKYFFIADGKCKIAGDTYTAQFDWETGETGDHGDDYLLSGPIRNKEEWYVFLKYTDGSSDNKNLILDIILINSKLFDGLPEPNDFDKLEDLNWEGEGDIHISNNNLAIFDGTYFNAPDKYKIPDNIKSLPNPWYEYIHRILMKQKEAIYVNPHGVVTFVTNGDYALYSIKDDTNDDVLAVDIEIYDTKDTATDGSKSPQKNKVI
jgi:hypothetical protein